MEIAKNKFVKSLPIVGTVIAIVSGGFGIWNYLKPEPELPQLEGKWHITVRVDDASKPDYLGDVMEYDVFVTQDGNKLSGNGEQVYYNGKPASKHFKFEIESAYIKDESVIVSYILHGNDRPTNAMFKLKLKPDDEKHLNGSYSGNAAKQSGVVEVEIQ